MLAATQAGMAFSNASVALVHGMSRPIGAHFHVAHGLSNAMLLPAITAFSVKGAESRYADCARAIGVATEATGDGIAAQSLVDSLAELCHDLAVPTPRDHGIDRARWNDLIPLMAQQALDSGSPGNNPVVPLSTKSPNCTSRSTTSVDAIRAPRCPTSQGESSSGRTLSVLPLSRPIAGELAPQRCHRRHELMHSVRT